METKRCIRCGVLIGYVAKNRRYCEKCRTEVRKESKRKPKKKPKSIPCAFCGRPMIQHTANQKYHKSCAYPARIAKMRELNVVYSDARREKRIQERQARKAEQEEKRRVPTIREIEAKARELGTTYGKVVLGIQTGKIHME